MGQALMHLLMRMPMSALVSEEDNCSNFLFILSAYRAAYVFVPLSILRRIW